MAAYDFELLFVPTPNELHRTWATIATLLATARLNGIDPQACLTTTLERLAAGWPNYDLDALEAAEG